MKIKLQGVVVNGAATVTALRNAQPIALPAGETEAIAIAVVDDAGNPVNLSTGQVLLTVKRTSADSSPLISRQATLDVGAGGTGSFPLTYGDTIALKGPLVYDVWFTDGSGNRSQVVPYSTFFVLPALGQPGQAVTVPPSQAGFVQPLPLQAGHGGQWLTTDGTTASWAALPPQLPSQGGHAGQFLTTDGTNASWATVSTTKTLQQAYADGGAGGGNITLDGTGGPLALHQDGLGFMNAFTGPYTSLTPGIYLHNDTAASGTVLAQDPPMLKFTGQMWDGAASKSLTGWLGYSAFTNFGTGSGAFRFYGTNAAGTVVQGLGVDIVPSVGGGGNPGVELSTMDLSNGVLGLYGYKLFHGNMSEFNENVQFDQGFDSIGRATFYGDSGETITLAMIAPNNLYVAPNASTGQFIVSNGYTGFGGNPITGVFFQLQDQGNNVLSVTNTSAVGLTYEIFAEDGTDVNAPMFYQRGDAWGTSALIVSRGGFNLVNTTAATGAATVQRSAPILHSGSAWDGAVSVSTRWTEQMIPVSGTVSASLDFAYAQSLGAFSTKLSILGTSGIVVNGRKIDPNATAPNLNDVLAWNGSAFVPAAGGGGGGSGTVTSVGMTVPAWLLVAGSPITTSGTLAVSAVNQSANTVLAGPTTGAAAAPTFRTLVAGDLPGGSLVNSVSNSDGTLTIGPATGAVVASLNLAHANTWTTTQTFQAVVPSVDNTYANGANATRWSNVVGVVLTSRFQAGDAIKNTPTDGTVLQNINTAVNNVSGDDGQVYSPRLRLTGAGRNTSGSSVVVDWDVFNRPVQGTATNPTTQLAFRSQINAGGYTEIVTFDSRGRLGVGSSNPSNTMEVRSDTASSIEPRLNVSSSDTSANYSGLQLGAGTVVSPIFKGGFFRLKSTDEISIWNPSAAVLKFDTSGNATPQSDNNNDWGASGTRYRNVYTLAVKSSASTLTLTTTVATGSSRAGFVLNDTNNGLNGTDKWLSFQYSGGERMYIADGVMSTTAGNMTYAATTRIILQGSGSQLWWDGSTLFPANDNVRNNGTPSNRWAGTYSTVYGGTSQNVAAAASVTISSTGGEFVRVTLGATAITSLTISAGTSAQKMTVEVVQDATGGRTIPTTWTNVRFAGGSYTASAGANAKDTITFRWNSTDSKWDEISRSMNIS